MKVFSTLSEVLRRDGLVGALRYIVETVKWQYVVYRYDIAFDKKYGVDTRGIEHAYLANVQSENVGAARPYEATKQFDFDRLMALIHVDRRRVVFVDAGSGKGRALFFAALAGFERIIGVEFSDELTQVARQNIEIFKKRTGCGASIEAHAADMTTFEFPDADILLYMYNPFGDTVMRHVMDRAVAFVRRTGRQFHIAYRNPTCAALIESIPGIEIVESNRLYAVYRLTAAVTAPEPAAAPSVCSAGLKSTS
jgi:SAM-dependent methyltransferase